jgi:hypothetical protein
MRAAELAADTAADEAGDAVEEPADCGGEDTAKVLTSL